MHLIITSPNFMKRSIRLSFLILCSFFLAILSINAQGNYEDVVYLKNGSIIHGVIIEQVPNQSIKIQTRDNNVFVYKMDEIEKIAKEIPSKGNQSNNGSGFFAFGVQTNLNFSLIGNQNESSDHTITKSAGFFSYSRS